MRSSPKRETVALVTLSALPGCANEGPPPGALPDFTPPAVAEIEPAPDSVVVGFDGSVEVRFDEPVRLSGNFGQQIQASPAGLYDVRTGFSDLRIRPKDGWRDGVIYCFEIPAGVTDLMNNRSESPVDFCFSTGPEVTATEAGGQLHDRVTGAPVRGARVLFLGPEADTVFYTAVSDNEGSFRLRALPPGPYEAYGFQDRNRNFRLDRTLEPYDSTTFDLPGAASSVSLELSLVEPDTTPPALVAATVVDSLAVRLEFDDPLPREQAVGVVTVRDSASGREVAVRTVRVGEPRETEPPPDPATDSAAAALDPDVVAADPGLPPDPVGEITPAGARPQATELPSQTVTVWLGEPLWLGTFHLTARGFVNLRGLSGDGEVTFSYEPSAGEEDPAAEETEAPSSEPRADTVSVRAARVVRGGG